MANDDDIATRIHRDVMARNPGEAALASSEAWKHIREGVRRWRQKLPAEDSLQAALFQDLDLARHKGVIR